MLNEQKSEKYPGNQGHIYTYIYIHILLYMMLNEEQNMPWKPGKYIHALETREIYTCPGNQGKQGNHIKLVMRCSMNKKKKQTCPGTIGVIKCILG